MNRWLKAMPAVLLVLGAMGTQPAMASYTLTLDTDPKGGGPLPGYTAPVATIADTGTNQVTITMSLSGGVSGQKIIPVWLFNFTGGSTAVTDLSPSYSSGTNADPVGLGGPFAGNGNSIGAGNFNVQFSFGAPTGLSNGSTSVYIINLTAAAISANKTLNASMFVTTPNANGYFSAVHIQGGTSDSQGLAANKVTAVPEPSSVVVLGVMGAAGLGVLRFRRRAL